MDPWNSILRWLDHNRYLAIGGVLFVVTMGWLGGCKSLTASLLNPGEKVDRAAFSAEAVKAQTNLNAKHSEIQKAIADYNSDVESMNALIEAGTEDLDAQDAQKAAVIEAIGGTVLNLVSGGPVNVGALATTGITLLTGLLGGGALVDNRRKDKVIRKIQNKNTPAATPGT